MDCRTDHPNYKSVYNSLTLGYAYALAGKRGEAQHIIDELQEQAKQKYVSPYFIAVIYSVWEDKDQAFEWLEKAYHEQQ